MNCVWLSIALLVAGSGVTRLSPVIPKGKLTVATVNHSCGAALEDTVEVAVSVEANLEAIDIGGFDFLFDPTQLEYVGHKRGGLTGLWAFFGATGFDGFVRVGGFNDIAIPPQSAGDFVILRFVPHCCETSGDGSLCLTTLVSDFFGMTVNCGSVTCVPLSTQPSSWGYVTSLYR